MRRTVSYVHQKSKMLENVCSNNWLLDFGNDETPGEGEVETKVESKQTFAMGLSVTAVKISLSGAWSEQKDGMILTYRTLYQN